MARGKQVYLSYAALVLLSYTTPAAADSLWSVNIDNGPAPPPELGPPFSAHALRDPSYLPYQILGIVGSYFIVVLFLGTLLLSCGQQARKRALLLAENPKTMEMHKPAKSYLKRVSGQHQQQRSRDSFGMKKSAVVSVNSFNSTISPGSESIVSFNQGIIEADKQKRANEMEKLYAAVMEQEEKRATGENMYSPAGSSPERANRSVKAIYPPAAAFVQHNRTTSIPPRDSQSPVSMKRMSGNSLASKKSRRSLKNVKISSPMQISAPIHINDNDDGARTPLAPRTYIDPGIPPEPPAAKTVDRYESSAWPTTGGERISAPEDYWEYLQGAEADRAAAAPTAYSQRQNKTRQNHALPLRVETSQPAAVSSTTPSNPLPFRQLHWNSPNSPMYPYQGQGPFSAGPTKTTFVEVRRDQFGAAPLTGMATPYSAYMPFSPVTPVAAHLTTAADRKQREREQRGLHGAITEEDQVKDDAELWDEGF
ncbi:hypothetical protein AMS68_004833 [Peltaster fructicola]|uniref:Uncharacterized protein n=1 Tax=Peltaster fructicola TaxID=286661 RepID=A0A6H0XXA8_9PEZI|nr:hypothetical protein AMS68_004833 [Peltaster fructicola]